jgi:membrane-associated protein
VLTTAPLALGPEWLSPDTLLTNYGNLGFWLAALVIFAECGLLLGFFLPGDSLLFTVGLFVGTGVIHHPLWLACLVLTVAAFVGNVVGYEIGRFSGPAIFNRGDSKIFKREYVDKTMVFFEQYGPRAIVLARFVPIVRTFITVTAGVGAMDRRKYLTYSGIGAVLWATGVTVLGRVLGSIAFIRDNIEAALILVVLVSVIPMAIEYLRHRAAARRAGSSNGPAGEASGGSAGEATARADQGYVPGSARGRHAGPVSGAEIQRAVAEAEDRH